MRLPSHHRYSWEQYLSFERTSNVKHEFFEGEIFAMAGGTPEHAALAAAVTGELHRQLDGKPCRPYSSDLRIRSVGSGLATYPDVTVVCGKPEYDPDAKDTLTNPTLLVEVLSDSTEAYDRGQKFESYRGIPSLMEYILVSHRERLIEVFRRGEHNEWTRSEARTKAKARLESLGCELDVDKIYAGIELHRSG
ncbi:MAG: Uma2 family endonuclease [Myxococcota bacterium]